MGEGSSPSNRMRSVPCAGSATGVAESKARVYGCMGLPKMASRGPYSYRAAEIHDHNVIGHMFDYRQAVTDEQVGKTESLLQVDKDI